MPAKQYIAFTFTLNNYNENEQQSLRTALGTVLGRAGAKVTYVIFGREVGESGTPHLQGYVRLDRKVSIKTFLESRGSIGLHRAHVEGAKGTCTQNIDYCSKDGDTESFGSAPVPGKRSDLEEIRELIAKGVPEHVIATDYFDKWVVYRRSFSAYRLLLRGVPRSWPTKKNKELMNNLSSYHCWSSWKSKILRIFSFLL
jgi:hypothetical protein